MSAPADSAASSRRSAFGSTPASTSASWRANSATTASADGAGSDRRRRARGRRIRPSPLRPVAGPQRADVGRDVGGGEVVEIEERAVRHRRHDRLAGDRAPPPSAGPGGSHAGRGSEPAARRGLGRRRAIEDRPAQAEVVASLDAHACGEEARIPPPRLGPDPARMLAHLELAHHLGEPVGFDDGDGRRRVVGVDEGDTPPFDGRDHDLHVSILPAADDSVGGPTSPWTHGRAGEAIMVAVSFRCGHGAVGGRSGRRRRSGGCARCACCSTRRIARVPS